MSLSEFTKLWSMDDLDFTYLGYWHTLVSRFRSKIPTDDILQGILAATLYSSPLEISLRINSESTSINNQFGLPLASLASHLGAIQGSLTAGWHPDLARQRQKKLPLSTRSCHCFSAHFHQYKIHEWIHDHVANLKYQHKITWFCYTYARLEGNRHLTVSGSSMIFQTTCAKGPVPILMGLGQDRKGQSVPRPPEGSCSMAHVNGKKFLSLKWCSFLDLTKY